MIDRAGELGVIFPYKRIILWSLYVLFFCFLPLLVYFFLFSPFGDKYHLVLVTRENFATTILNIRKNLGYNETNNCKLFFQPIREIINSGNDNTKHIYALSGKLVRVVSDNSEIYIKTCNGGLYKFEVPIVKDDEDGWVSIPNAINTDDQDKIRSNDGTFTFFEDDLQLSGERDKKYRNGQFYLFVWLDGRDLTEIYNELQEHPDRVLNYGNTSTLGLYRSVDEVLLVL